MRRNVMDTVVRARGRITEEQREKLHEGNYPLARMVQDGSDMSAPRAGMAKGRAEAWITPAESPLQSNSLNTKPQVSPSTSSPGDRIRQPGNSGRETQWKDDPWLDGSDFGPVSGNLERVDGPKYLMPGQSEFHDGDTNALDRIAGTAVSAVSDLFEGPYGIAHEDLGPLVNQSREDAYTPVLGFIRTFNEVLIEGGSQLGDLALRTTVAPFVGGVVAVGQTAIELGMTPTEARRLVRDLYVFGEVSLAEIGSGATAGARVRARGTGYLRRDRHSGSLIERMEQAGNLDGFLAQFPTDQHADILKQIQRSYEQGQRLAQAQIKKRVSSTGNQNLTNKITKVAYFVDDAVKDKSRTQTLVLNEVDAAEAVRLKLDTGLDLTGYRHIIDGSGVRHTLRAHGNPATEASRGQLAISGADFSIIPAIIADPDRVAYAGTNKIGRDIILYEKRINNVYYYVEEVRTGRKLLALQSMWKRK